MGSLMQLSLAGDLARLETKRARFLAEVERLIPWAEIEAIVEPRYPRPGSGRPPRPLAEMLRLWLVREWWQLTDADACDLAADSAAVQVFVGLPLGSKPPGRGTLQRFRALIESSCLCDIQQRLAQSELPWHEIVPGSIAEPALRPWYRAPGARKGGRGTA